MNYIVLDLEWNQASDLHTKLENTLLFEILEIGAVKLDENRHYVDKFHELIRPQVFHKMHQITGELIHLRLEDLVECREFTQVCEDFLKWCGDDYIFCTWGNLDLTELMRNMDYYDMPPICEGPLKFYDAQKLFSIAYEDGKVRRNLEYAVDYLDIEKNIAFHRADSDAYYTARVMEHIEDSHVYEFYSYDTHHIPARRKDEVYAVFDNYSKFISIGFKDRPDAIHDKRVSATKCIYCDKALPKIVPWFTTNNGKHYYSLSFCEEHGYFKGKARMKKTDEGRTYVVKTLRNVGPDVAVDIIKKREKNFLDKK